MTSASRSKGEDVAAIAVGLTKAQRRSILHAYQTRKPAGGQQFWTVDITCQPWPEGVAQYRSPNTDTLTPLGLAVRQHLTDQEGQNR